MFTSLESKALKSFFCSTVIEPSFDIASRISFQRALFSSKFVLSEINCSLETKISRQVCFLVSASFESSSLQAISFGIKFFKALNILALSVLFSCDSTSKLESKFVISLQFLIFNSSINLVNSIMTFVFSLSSFHSSLSLCR